MVSVVVSDLDGTLLNGNHRVSEYTVERIRKLVDHNIEFMIATGRHYCDIRHFPEMFGEGIYLISSNGAQIHDREGKLIHSVSMPKAQVDDVIRISREFNVKINIYDGEAWYVEEPNRDISSLQTHTNFYYECDRFEDLPLENVFKFYFTAEHESLVKLNHALELHFASAVSISFSVDTALEVMANNVSKGRALEIVSQRESFSLEKIMAFGDGLNDLDMLSTVGHAVVMENANPRMKRLLDKPYQTTRLNTEDGVAYYLDKFFW